MAFDQVSLFLYPPRWKRHSVADTLMKHYSGEAVRIVSAVRAESNEPTVRFDDVCRWFETKHFEVVNRSAKHGHFCSGSLESVFGGRRTEIAVSTGTMGDEVSSLYCRFLINREAPLRLERWEAFMQELCGEFKLRISVSDTELVDPNEFLTVLRQGDAWRHFADQFGWSDPSE